MLLVRLCIWYTRGFGDPAGVLEIGCTYRSQLAVELGSYNSTTARLVPCRCILRNWLFEQFLKKHRMESAIINHQLTGQKSEL
jgi:hypothetical protein